MKQKSRDENSDEDTETTAMPNPQNTNNYDKINGTKLLNCNENFLDERASKSENNKCSSDHGNLNNGTKEILENGKYEEITDNLSSALGELTLGTENHTELNRAFCNLKIGSQPNQQEQRELSKQLANRNELPEDSEDNLEQKVSDSLVKLSAPSFDDNEEEEEEEEQAVPEGQEALEERGPMHGVPSSYTSQQAHLLPPHQQGFHAAANYQPAMPPNFPDYSSHSTWKTSSKGPKRVSEDITYEPPKYVRPYDSGIPDMNNLNEPGYTQHIYSGNLKTINQVSRTQMSGATVIAQGMVPQAAANHNCTGDLAKGELIPVGFMCDETFTNLAKSDCWYSQEADAFQAQTVQSNQYRHWNIGPDSRGGCDDFSDNGYGSDFSPQNDSHSSPLPSPPSVSAGSVSLSPPPSNDSADSGVHSPPLTDLYYGVNQGKTIEYHSKYIDEHPELLMDSLLVAQNDLQTMAARTQPDHQFTSSTRVTCPLPPPPGTRVTCPLPPHTGILVSCPLPPTGSTISLALSPPSFLSNVQRISSHFPKQPSSVFVPPPATATSPSQAPPNKVAIPKQQQVVVLQQPVTPILFVSSQAPLAKPNNHTTYRPIAPKDPTKQLGNGSHNGVVKNPQVSNNIPAQSPQASDKSSVKSPQASSCQGSTGSVKPTHVAPTSPPDQGKQAVQKGSIGKMNLARRLVAEMKTDDLTIKDDDLDTYLHVAVLNTDRYMVQALLERFTREGLTDLINAQNKQQQTPLHLAICLNEPDKVGVLVQYKADANILAQAQKSSGCMEMVGAIHCASTNGAASYETLTELLKSPSIDPNLVNSDGHTALICAILAHGKMDTNKTKINSIPIIQLLGGAGADLNLQVPQSGKTALMYALESRDLDLIEGIFKLVEPSKMADILKTQAFDKSTCLKIAESLKDSLDSVSKQRLSSCLNPAGHKMS